MSDNICSQKFKDRRIKISQALPLIDSKGNMITSERRRGVPDPRFGGIEITKLSISQKEFEDYFNKVK